MSNFKKVQEKFSTIRELTAEEISAQEEKAQKFLQEESEAVGVTDGTSFYIGKVEQVIELLNGGSKNTGGNYWLGNL